MSDDQEDRIETILRAERRAEAPEGYEDKLLASLRQRLPLGAPAAKRSRSFVRSPAFAWSVTALLAVSAAVTYFNFRPERNVEATEAWMKSVGDTSWQRRVAMAGLDLAEGRRQRLNQVYYWQLSDELKLSIPQRRAMVAVIEDIERRRTQALTDRNEALSHLRKVAVAPEWLATYRASIESSGRLDVEEYERLSAALGPEILARYYVVRETVLTRLRAEAQP